MENINLENPEATQEENKVVEPEQKMPEVPKPQADQPGFWALFTGSFKMTLKHFLSYLKMTLILLLPFIAVGALISLLMAVAFAEEPASGTPKTPVAISQDAAEATTDTKEETKSDELFANPATKTATDTKTSADTGEGTSDTPSITDALKTVDGMKIDGTALDEFKSSTFGSAVSKTSATNLGSTSALSSGGPMTFMAFFSMAYAIFVLIFVVYEIVIILALTKLTVLINKKEELHYWQMIKWSFKKIGAYILLMIRAFFYTYSWIPFAILILGFILESMGINIDGPLKYPMFAIGIAWIVIFIIRIPRTIFAQYVLADRECTSKEALNDSINAATGHWWKVILYSLAYGILTMLGIMIIVWALGLIHQLISGIVGFILILAWTYASLMFIYKFYLMLKGLNSKA